MHIYTTVLVMKKICGLISDQKLSRNYFYRRPADKQAAPRSINCGLRRHAASPLRPTEIINAAGAQLPTKSAGS